jgi:RNA polymerase sigma factor (sigma-70 family)
MSHSPNWKELVQSCIRNDRAAQLEVYKRIWRDIFPAIQRIVKDKQQAEDIMQESIIKGFDKLSTLRTPETYPAWQRKLAVNDALMWWRKKGNRNFDHDPLMNEDAEEEWIEEPVFEHMEQELNQLPEGYRMVIQLHALEQMKHEEIAEALQVATSTVRSQYSRGLALLRKQMELKKRSN